jgi:hypothetical protein
MECPGSRVWFLRRRARGLESQRCRAPRRRSFSLRVCIFRAGAAVAARKRQSSHRARRVKLDVAFFAAPGALADTPRVMRNSHYNTFHAPSSVCAESLGRPAVSEKGQYRLGPSPTYTLFAGTSSPGPASRRGGAAAARRWRMPSAPTARPRISRRPRLDRRTTQRPPLSHSLARHASLAIHDRALQSAAAASAAWTDICVGFAHAAPGRGLGVAAAAALIWHS